MAVFGGLDKGIGLTAADDRHTGQVPGKFEFNAAIFELNGEQRKKGISPQCDLNGTLCGAPRRKGK